MNIMDNATIGNILHLMNMMLHILGMSFQNNKVVCKQTAKL